MRSKHPSVPGQFKCDICGKRFNSKSYLIAHRYKAHKVNVAGRPINVKCTEPQLNEVIGGEQDHEDIPEPSTDKQQLEMDRKRKCQHCDKGRQLNLFLE